MYAPMRDGTRLFFDVDGVGYAIDGVDLRPRPVLFLAHGGPGSTHMPYKRFLSGLREICQLVFVDFRGCGLSEGAPNRSLESDAQDIDDLRRHLGLERINLYGASYGGMVALQYALDYPSSLVRLVLCATAASHRFLTDASRWVAENGTDEQQRHAERLFTGTFASLDELLEFYRVMSPAYSRTYDPEHVDPVLSIPFSYEALNVSFGGYLREFDLSSRLGEISVPTLVLSGDQDWICPAHHSKEIATAIPNSQLVIFEGCGHDVAVDRPFAFHAAVAEFLTNH